VKGRSGEKKGRGEKKRGGGKRKLGKRWEKDKQAKGNGRAWPKGVSRKKEKSSGLGRRPRRGEKKKEGHRQKVRGQGSSPSCKILGSKRGRLEEERKRKGIEAGTK